MLYFPLFQDFRHFLSEYHKTTMNLIKMTVLLSEHIWSVTKHGHWPLATICLLDIYMIGGGSYSVSPKLKLYITILSQPPTVDWAYNLTFVRKPILQQSGQNTHPRSGCSGCWMKHHIFLDFPPKVCTLKQHWRFSPKHIQSLLKSFAVKLSQEEPQKNSQTVKRGDIVPFGWRKLSCDES